jgi:hypothetical protein
LQISSYNMKLQGEDFSLNRGSPKILGEWSADAYA